MEQKKVVIASVLKPVNDTRMYEKFALSISQATEYEVNIIGFESKNIPDSNNINFHPIFKFKRLSIKRLLIGWKLVRCLIQIRPDLIIFNTHELLWPAIFYKLITRSKIIYDIRENYYLNILHLNSFPSVLRRVLATYVRLKERLLCPFVDHFILAEQCYKKQLQFLAGNTTVIENKAIGFSHNQRRYKGEMIQLLFTGTISESTGIFDVITFSEKLHASDPRIKLTIAGYCANQSTWNSLLKRIQSCDFIDIVGGNNLVPHSKIESLISQSNFGFIHYPKNPATANKIPTKLYEYLAAELPIITSKSEPIYSITKKYQAAIYADFQSPDISQILNEIDHYTFYEKTPKSEVLWRNEEVKFVNLIHHNIL